MLLLPFFADNNQYALPAAEVVEVLPCVRLRPISQTPAYVAGVFNYRGLVVPVIDVGMLLHARPCPARLGTRIMLVQYDAGGHNHILGLMAERVTRLVTVDHEAFASSGVDSPLSCVGKIAANGPGMLQLLRTAHMVPEELRQVLFVDQRQGAV